MLKFHLGFCFLFFFLFSIIFGNFLEEPGIPVQKRARPGIVIYRKYPRNSIQYLLLQRSHRVTPTWSPPKSRYSDRFNFCEYTGLRALLKQTGLGRADLRIIPNFVKQLHYILDGVSKNAVYFLAEIRDPQRKINISLLHKAFKWAPLDEACELVRFPHLRDLLLSSYDHLKLIKVVQ